MNLFLYSLMKKHASAYPHKPPPHAGPPSHRWHFWAVAFGLVVALLALLLMNRVY